MDPIRSSNKIFKKLANEFKGKQITQLAEVEKFFSRLIEETDGLVIVDFLDTSNWDNIHSFTLDKESRILNLVWDDYHSFSIAIKSIVPIVGENYAIFLLSGFSKTGKEIRKLYEVEGAELELFSESLFEKRILRECNNKREIIRFHCTPFFSIAIMPKNIGLSTFDSKSILYKSNIHEAVKRLQLVTDSLAYVEPLDHDLICEKVNTARRVLEFVLKIECCYKGINFDKSYSQILLGNLLGSVKKTKDEEINSFLGKMVEWLNEFSHDSGKEVDIRKAIVVCSWVRLYTEILRREIE